MAKSILDPNTTVAKQETEPTRPAQIVLPKNDLTQQVTRQYCELNLLGAWFADDPSDTESLGSCSH